MKGLMILFVAVFMTAISSAVFAQDWNSSPYNWQNSPYNWQNSPHNWQNSPHNWQNSRHNWGNERVIRDERGNAQGYAVPRSDGGVNFFGYDGTRQGYLPGR
jgi:hypothetical protein